jgi:hypothetical protein
MSTKMLYRVITGWFVAMAGVVALGLAAGVPVTLGMGVLVLVVAVVPPSVVFSLFRRENTQTVAEMLRQ